MRPVRCLLAATFALAVAGPAADQGPLHEGVARYHYYQRDYLPALTELMVARERDELDERRGAVLEGAIRLAFGMPDSAGQRLDTALTDRPGQAAAARFYRGKLHYLRGDWSTARSIWTGSAGEALKPALAREQQALLRQGRLAGGESPGEPDPDKLWDSLGEWAPSVLYNLGGAHARAGQHEIARRYYHALIDDVPDRLAGSEEYLAWRDRAHTALGFGHLLAGDYGAALADFDRVRLTRAGAEQALLGYGWAALERGENAGAIRAWQALSERPLTGSAAQEALVALPHAYRQRGAEAAALRAYDRAEQRLENERERLDALSERLGPDYLLEQLERAGQGGELQLEGRENWLKLADRAVAASADPYLADWVNRSEFQAGIQALSDLRDQDRLLAQWPDKLSHYRQLLRHKRALRRSTEAVAEREALLQTIDRLERQREPLAAETERIEREADYLAVADADTRALYRRATEALARLDRLTEAGAVEEAESKRARLENYRGLLRWRAAQAFPDNLWRARKQLRDLDLALDEARDRRDRLEAIVREDPDIEPALAQMDRLEARIGVQRERLAGARRERAEALVARLREHLGAHEQRIERYLTRVRLAAARLQDEARREGGGGGRD